MYRGKLGWMLLGEMGGMLLGVDGKVKKVILGIEGERMDGWD